MNRGLKILTVVLGIVAVLFVMSGVALATTVVRSGMVSVQVDENGAGDDLHIVVPAGLVYAGLALAPTFAGDEMAEARRNLEEVGPELHSLLQELEDCPDAVLLEATSPGESVRIEKRGRSLEIHVHDAQSNVTISLPADLAARVVSAVS
jgi:hypothetical protein